MNPEEQGQGQQVDLTPEVIVGAIESNPELAQAIQPHVLTKDAVSSFLKTDEGLGVVAPMIDQSVSKGINAWKEKNLENIVQERLAELNPAETPEQKQLKQMQAQMAAIQKDKQMLEMRGVAQEALAKAGLPASLAGYVLSDNPEAVKHKVSELDIEIQNIVSGLVDQKVAGIAAKAAPTNSDDMSNIGGSKTVERLTDLTVEEATELARTNPAKYRQLVQRG
ncbi:hypothetical protein [Enterococcus phage vB_EfaS_EF1c55]|uniref:DUF4355 domain-containing protein n=1 Tax=Enterococcus phage PMBT56 TaxID=3229530 RepID=A0AB39C6C4_9CAUD|nr:hypothetical protein [Enterococcus phage vB_EfaS_EF1c55]UKM17582.1 hypothetical protein [Enterococcus phage UTI-EfS7]UQT01123.1 hypothetical protein LMOIWNZ_00098 [Enterococcus phage vB_OCPT_CCS3]UQT01190.1 hypothetical protein QOFMPA_00067 [Enterococcus phage vB_OCPT_Toy]